MSRRKQSKPRQIKRSLGELDGNEDNAVDNLSLSGEEAEASDLDDSAEGDSSSPPPYTPPYNEEPRTQDTHGDADEAAGEVEGERRLAHSGGKEKAGGQEEDGVLQCPDELELSEEGNGGKVVTRRHLLADTVWGPYPGSLQSDASADDGAASGTSA